MFPQQWEQKRHRTNPCVPEPQLTAHVRVCAPHRPGDSQFRAFKLDLLGVKDGPIAEITAFGAALFPALGPPATLP